MQSEREMASQRLSLGQQSQGGAGRDSDYTFSTVPKEFLAIVHQNTVRTLPSRSHVPSLEIPLTMRTTRTRVQARWECVVDQPTEACAQESHP